MALQFAVDTNVLLRLSNRNDPQHNLIAGAMLRLSDRRVEFCFTSQSLGEFWNVSTRALDRNGLGLSVQETNRRFQALVHSMKLLPETEDVFMVWQLLMLANEVRGVQVHDAHIAAVLEVHGVRRLLTLNGRDFKRFVHIIPVHPKDVP